MSSESHQLFGEDHYLTDGIIDFFYKCYLRDEKDQHDMVAFGSNATIHDVTDLPPALMVTGEADPLRDGSNKHIYLHSQSNLSF